MPRRPTDPPELQLIQALAAAPTTETDLTCALYPQLVVATRRLLVRLRALGYCRVNANGTRWVLTAEGRARLGRP